MTTVFEVNNFNSNTVTYFPHNDYAKAADQTTFLTETGLMKVLRPKSSCLFEARQPSESLQYFHPDLLSGHLKTYWRNRLSR